MLKQLLSITLFLSLVGCTNMQVVRNYTATKATFNLPPIGVITERGIGENLLEQGEAGTKEVLVIEKTTSFMMNTVSSGILDKIGGDNNYEYFEQKNGVLVFGGLNKVPLPNAIIAASKLGNKICIVNGLNTPCGTADITRKTIDFISENKFKRTWQIQPRSA